MKSAKCYECGFVGWADADFCKKCGAAQAPPAVDGADQTQQSYGNNRPGSRSGSPGELKKGLAVASLVVGIISCFTFGGLLGIGAAVGVTLGIVAMVKANRYPSAYGGKSLATAGLISSLLSLVIVVPVGIIAAIAIPNLLAARRSANEGASIAVVKRIFAAEATYQAVHGSFGDLDKLAAEHLIEPEFAARAHYGYRFTVIEHSSPAGFELTGVPESYPSSGVRSFYIDETGVIHAADRRGAESTKLDPPLQDSYSSTPYRRTSYPPADRDE